MRRGKTEAERASRKCSSTGINARTDQARGRISLERFWDAVSAKLDQLQLKPVKRTKIEDQIARVVGRVPEDEAIAFKNAQEEWWAGLEQLWRLKELLRQLVVGPPSEAPLYCSLVAACWYWVKLSVLS